MVTKTKRKAKARRKIVAPKHSKAMTNGKVIHAVKESPIEKLTQLADIHEGRNITPEQIKKARRDIASKRDELSELTGRATRLKQAIDQRVASHKPADSGASANYYSIDERDRDAAALRELESKIKFVAQKIEETIGISRKKTESDSLAPLLNAVTRLARSEHAQHGAAELVAKHAAQFFAALETLYAPADEHARAVNEFTSALRELDGCGSQIVLDRTPESWGKVIDPFKVTGTMQRLLSTAPGNREASAEQLQKAFAGA